MIGRLPPSAFSSRIALAAAGGVREGLMLVKAASVGGDNGACSALDEVELTAASVAACVSLVGSGAGIAEDFLLSGDAFSLADAGDVASDFTGDFAAGSVAAEAGSVAAGVSASGSKDICLPSMALFSRVISRRRPSLSASLVSCAPDSQSSTPSIQQISNSDQKARRQKKLRVRKFLIAM